MLSRTKLIVASTSVATSTPSSDAPSSVWSSFCKCGVLTASKTGKITSSISASKLCLRPGDSIDKAEASESRCMSSSCWSRLFSWACNAALNESSSLDDETLALVLVSVSSSVSLAIMPLASECPSSDSGFGSTAFGSSGLARSNARPMIASDTEVASRSDSYSFFAIARFRATSSVR